MRPLGLRSADPEPNTAGDQPEKAFQSFLIEETHQRVASGFVFLLKGSV
jgi:hypothetical protein